MAYFQSEYDDSARGARPAGAVAAQSALIMAAEAGRFFQDLRRALHLSPVDAARRLATRPDIVTALEMGDIGALPPWPETCRIVRTYTGLAGLDPRPILFSLEQLRAASAHAPKPRPALRISVPHLPDLSGVKRSIGDFARLPARAMSAAIRKDNSGPIHAAPAYTGEVHADAPSASEAHSGEHPNRMAKRVLFGLSLPVALIVLVTQTSVLEAAVSNMPPPVARFVRGAQEYIAVKMAPVRNGMRWIEVDDPRSRRGDKLQTAVQSD